MARTLIVGDSLSDGFYASDIDKGYAPLVLSALAPVETTQAVIAHETLSVVGHVTEVPDDLDLAVIELGTNDEGLKTPLAQFRTGYAGLITRIRDASKDAAIVCLGTWTDAGTAYNEAIRSGCEKAGGRYVSLAAKFDVKDYHGPAGKLTPKGKSDWFHPNDAGHRAIANAVLSQLQVAE